MRALITGSEGDIGKALEKELLKENWTVDRISLRPCITSFYNRVKYDLLIHNAAIYYFGSVYGQNIPEILRVNLEVPIRLTLNLNYSESATVLLLSTKDLGQPRHFLPNQVLYNTTKAAMEEFIISMEEQRPDLNWKIIRLPLVKTKMLDPDLPMRETPITKNQAVKLILKEVPQWKKHIQ